MISKESSKHFTKLEHEAHNSNHKQWEFYKMSGGPHLMRISDKLPHEEDSTQNRILQSLNNEFTNKTRFPRLLFFFNVCLLFTVEFCQSINSNYLSPISDLLEILADAAFNLNNRRAADKDLIWTNLPSVCCQQCEKSRSAVRGVKASETLSLALTLG
jgi:hypothetical protein